MLTGSIQKGMSMSQYMDNKWSWIDGSHAMRTGLLDNLTDADLAFSLGGQTMTFGALWREMGEVEYDYLQSLKTFKTDFSYRNPQAGLDTSVAALRAWFEKLDAEMKEILSGFSDDDFKKDIVRASGYTMPLELQLDVYLQALLIFFGKATIYFKAMSKPLPPAVQEYVW
jgi:hypothetical protein